MAVQPPLLLEERPVPVGAEAEILEAFGEEALMAQSPRPQRTVEVHSP